MRTTTAKTIDQLAGSILVRLAGVLPARPLPNPAEIDRILIVKFWGIGSIILLQPVVFALRRAYPDARITLCTLERNRGLFSLLPAIDDFMTLDLKSPLRCLGDLLALPRKIRRGRFDLAIDCEFFARLASILVRLSSAPLRIGFVNDDPARTRLYTSGVPYRHDCHVTATFGELLAPLGLTMNPAEARLPDPAPEVAARAAKLLASHGVDRFAAVNVNASDLAHERRWPPDRFATLLQRLVDDLGLSIVLVGSEDERHYVDAVRQAADRGASIVNLAGATSIRLLQAILRKAEFFVSNDSGPLHLAAASGVPCVALFGPETPSLYGPQGDGHEILYRDLPCSPCMSVHAMKQVVCHGAIDCLKEITVDEVFACSSRLLQQRLEAEAIG